MFSTSFAKGEASARAADHLILISALFSKVTACGMLGFILT